MSFLRSYEPSPILLQAGPLTFYWYGFLYAVSIALGYWLVSRTLRRQNGSTLAASLPDLTLALVVVGLLGARAYHVLNELAYYGEHPGQIIAIWNGGLAIHGAILADLLFLWWYAEKLTAASEADGSPPAPSRSRLSAYGFLLDLLAPAVLLGQAIGRWGNYFNQELFGYPTTLPWGIPIAAARRPAAFAASTHFHPAFLYESLWDLVGAAVLLLWTARRGRRTARPGAIFFAYLAYAGLGRFLVELVRVDPVPLLAAVRLPAIVALGGTVVGAAGLLAIALTRPREGV